MSNTTKEPRKVDKLTPEEEAIMHQTREEWIKRGLGGDTSTDDAKLAELTNWIYSFGGNAPPRTIIVDSPLGCQVAQHILRRFEEIEKSGWSVDTSLNADNSANSLPPRVSLELFNHTFEVVKRQVSQYVPEGLRESVFSATAHAALSTEMQFDSFSCLGAADYGWTAFYDFFAKIGVVTLDKFFTWSEYVKAGAWDSLMFDTYHIISRRPKTVSLDADNRLHNMSGPAATWEDPVKNYFLHGMSVKEEWVENPMSITLDDVLKQENVELRRAMITLRGVDVLLDKAKVIDTDTDKPGGQRRLLKIKMRNDEDVAIVELTCPSTEKKHYIRVDPKVKTCRQAVAASHGFSNPDDYDPIEEA